MKPKTQAMLKTKAANRERRASLVMKTYTLKLDKSKIDKVTLALLHLLFKEAKWLYNTILAVEGDNFNYDTKTNKVYILDQNKNKIEKELTVIGSHMKQSIRDRVKRNILNLNKAKKAGLKVGKLKFQKIINIIELRQPNDTYDLKGNELRIQGFKHKFKVNGIEQLKNVIEYGPAKLVRKCNDFYLNVLCYETLNLKNKTNKIAGIDFGLKTTLTVFQLDTLTGQINHHMLLTEVPISIRLKRLQRGLFKKTHKSQNWYKQKTKVEKEHLKITNKKKDLRNKVIHDLTNSYDLICIQDESISNWKNNSWNNRKIQNSSLGGIISGLKKKPETLIVDKYFKSTKTCICGKTNDIGRSRVYSCSCGYTKDRDIHAASNILKEGLKNHPLWCITDVKTLGLGVANAFPINQEALAI